MNTRFSQCNSATPRILFGANFCSLMSNSKSRVAQQLNQRNREDLVDENTSMRSFFVDFFWLDKLEKTCQQSVFEASEIISIKFWFYSVTVFCNLKKCLVVYMIFGELLFGVKIRRIFDFAPMRMNEFARRQMLSQCKPKYLVKCKPKYPFHFVEKHICFAKYPLQF